MTLGVPATAVAVPGTAVAQEPPAPTAQDLPGLIRAVADAGARLDRARSEISGKREGVNKTLVDLQIARVQLDQKIADADRATEARKQADTGVTTARGTLQDFARTMYRQGTAPGAASTLLDPAGPDDAVRRQEMLSRASADQRTVVDDMEKARVAADTREHEAVDARGVAQQHYDDASRKRDAATTEIATVGQEVRTLEGEVRDLTTTLTTAENDLRAKKGESGPVAPKASDQGPSQGPSNQDVALRDQALARLSAQPQVTRFANQVAAALPSHLDLGAVRQFAAGSTDQAGHAGRALGGTIDAGSVGKAADAATSGDTDALVQQVVDAISRADMGSAEQKPSAPSKPGTTTPPTSGGGQAGGTDGQSTGDVSRDVRIVIDRAKSQLGLPYAWGGGDAKGPTLGIRDGGVADSYGDFAKTGFDCSGLMIYAFAGVGIELAHYTGYQYTAGTQVPVGDMKPGDMLFWGPGGSNHVALYIGDGKMIEAPQSGDVVKISPVRMSGIEPFAVRMIE